MPECHQQININATDDDIYCCYCFEFNKRFDKACIERMKKMRKFKPYSSVELTSNLFLTGGAFPALSASKQAADHERRSPGWVRIAALVNCFRISGSAGGILICSAQYIGSLAGRGIMLLQDLVVYLGFLLLSYFVCTRVLQSSQYFCHKSR